MTRRVGAFPLATQDSSTFGFADGDAKASIARSEDITVWCSNDYMGMGQVRFQSVVFRLKCTLTHLNGPFVL